MYSNFLLLSQRTRADNLSTAVSHALPFNRLSIDQIYHRAAFISILMMTQGTQKTDDRNDSRNADSWKNRIEINAAR